MDREVCLITGVGPGTGTALAKRFAEKYHVAMIARDEERLQSLSATIDYTSGHCCDVTDSDALTATLDAIDQKYGTPVIVIHNAVGGSFGDVLTIKLEVLEKNFRVNTMALLQIIQHCAPAMVENGKGVIMATGNTSAYRGKSNFAGFAPTKAAQRILLESTARSLGPKGVHAAYIAIDAVIDLEWTRNMLPDAEDEFFAKPEEIAAECFHIAHQPRSAWTFDALIRPFGESW